MELKKLFQDDSAVSPVIGVILMVAITVILAAVIGTFVLGLGGQVGNNAPSANVGFEYSTAASANWVNATHNGGDPLQVDNLDLKVGGNSAADLSAWVGGDNKITAGDSISVTDGSSIGEDTSLSSGSISDGDKVQLIWESPGGGDTAIIAQGTVSL